jgi:hypothetical protein
MESNDVVSAKFAEARTRIHAQYAQAREELGLIIPQSEIDAEGHLILADLRFLKAHCLCGHPTPQAQTGFCRQVRDLAQARVEARAWASAGLHAEDCAKVVRAKWAEMRQSILKSAVINQ